MSDGMLLHLVKLCVGIEKPEQLEALIARRHGAGETPYHITRQTPRRADEILDGGSLYWVMKGVILSRQRIAAIEPVERNGKPHCKISFDPKLVRTEPMLKRPFQGWRYLKAEDAPADLRSGAAGGDDLPPELRRKLMQMGAW